MPAPKGIYAFYEENDATTTGEPVMAFREDGMAMILSKRGMLIPVNEPQNFIGLDWLPE